MLANCYAERPLHATMYAHVPPDVLEFANRRVALLKEITTMAPDVCCLQEIELDECARSFGRIMLSSCHSSSHMCMMDNSQERFR